MVLSGASLIATVLSISSCLLPGPHDGTGWGLRIRILNRQEPYFANEYMDGIKVAVVLINNTSRVRQFVRSDVVRRIGDMELTILRPDGMPNSGMCRFIIPDDNPPRVDLHPGKFEVLFSKLSQFGYVQPLSSGRYVLKLTLRTREGRVTAPPETLVVRELNESQTLESTPLRLVGRQATYPPFERTAAYIEQVEVNRQVWLIFRQSYRGLTSSIHRITSLPAPAVTKITGGYGDDKPITVSYALNNQPSQTMLTVSPIDGSILKRVVIDH